MQLLYRLTGLGQIAALQGRCQQRSRGGELLLRSRRRGLLWGVQLFPSSKPKVIVDICANIGVFSKLCSMLFPDADLYACEPNPAALKWLRQSAAGTRVGVMPFAVARAGVVELDTSCDSTIGRVIPEGDLAVECIAVSDMLTVVK